MPHSNPNNRHPGHGPHGFSLIELLVIIAVLGILASLIVGVSRKVYTSSQKTIAMSGLRSVGTAIQLYAQDNQGYLPGPLWSTTNAFYNGNDDRSLGYNLAPYLDLPEPGATAHEFPQVSCPLFEEMRPANGTPAYFIQQRVTLPEGNRNPWGYRRNDQTKDEASKPQKMDRVVMDNNSEVWAMCAADADNVTNPDAGWASNLLPEPLFGDERLQLYFDWHVEFVPVE